MNVPLGKCESLGNGWVDRQKEEVGVGKGRNRRAERDARREGRIVVVGGDKREEGRMTYNQGWELGGRKFNRFLKGVFTVFLCFYFLLFLRFLFLLLSDQC